LLLVVPLLALGCGDDEKQPTPIAAKPGTYVGAVDGTDMRVGIVAGSAEAIAFFCGGSGSLDSTVWLRGKSALRDIGLTSGVAKLSATASGSAIAGKLEPGDGRSLSFSASFVPDDGAAGLYDATDGEGHAGVIVIATDAFQGAFIRATDGRAFQIVPIRPGPIELQEKSFAVSVEARTITVRRVPIP
jgi:hypothetical protein